MLFTWFLLTCIGGDSFSDGRVVMVVLLFCTVLALCAAAQWTAELQQGGLYGV